MRSEHTYIKAVHGFIYRTPAYSQPVLTNHLNQPVSLNPHLGLYEVITESPLDLTKSFSTAVMQPDPLYGWPIYRADTEVLLLDKYEAFTIQRDFPETQQAFFQMVPPLLSEGVNPLFGIQATLEELELWTAPLKEIAIKMLSLHIYAWLINIDKKEQVLESAWKLQRTAFWNEELIYRAAAAIRLIDEDKAQHLLNAYQLKDKDKYFFACNNLLEDVISRSYKK